MAFPQIADADTKNGTVTSNSTSWTLTYPTNLVSGDLIVVCMAVDGDGGQDSTPPTFPAGFNRRGVGFAAITSVVACKISDGTETGTFTVTIAASEQGAWRIFRIPAASWFGSGLIEDAQSSLLIRGDGISLVDANPPSGASNIPDPPSLTPRDLTNNTNWGTTDALWIAMCAVDTSRTISVYPLAGRNTADISGGSNGATLGLCTTESTASSLNPGTFTISASDDWNAITIAIRPAAVVVVDRNAGFIRPRAALQAVNRASSW